MPALWMMNRGSSDMGKYITRKFPGVYISDIGTHRTIWTLGLPSAKP